jgi:hypothetical protein
MDLGEAVGTGAEEGEEAEVAKEYKDHFEVAVDALEAAKSE